ncbi:MAG: site-2 protease family protein [Candidatus Omnitrophota bacterium]
MINIIISIIVFVIVIVTHELAHGYTAYLLGDRTAKDAGRLTINPIAHADVMGTFILPLVLLFVRSPIVFGWARPVPVNPANFKSPRKGMLLTSLAGPGANFTLAFLFAIIFKTGVFPPHSIIWTFLLSGILISLILGVFNLIPVPPLDGANVLMALLPPSKVRYFLYLEKYGFIILITLLYFGFFDRIILPLVGILTRILLC